MIRVDALDTYNVQRRFRENAAERLIISHDVELEEQMQICVISIGYRTQYVFNAHDDGFNSIPCVSLK
jgi:hypothetical protein